MPRRKIIREFIDERVRIEHPVGQMGDVSRIVPVVCKGCGKTFYQNALRATKGRIIKCGWCGVELEVTHKKRYEVKLH